MLERKRNARREQGREMLEREKEKNAREREREREMIERKGEKC